MRHFAEFIVFNGFNSISFRTAAKAAVARADEKPGPRPRRFLKNNAARQRLWQEIVAFCRAPLRGWRAALGEWRTWQYWRAYGQRAPVSRSAEPGVRPMRRAAASPAWVRSRSRARTPGALRTCERQADPAAASYRAPRSDSETRCLWPEARRRSR